MPRRRTGRKPGRPPGSVTTARSDMELFSQLHRSQARFWRLRQRQLFALVEALPPGQGMPPAIVEEMQQIDEFLQRASSAIVQIQRAHDREFEGLTTEQLRAQLSAEFIAAVATWTPEQWNLVEAARAKRIREAQQAQAATAASDVSPEQEPTA